VVVLSKTGAQVPVMPLVDVVGNGASVPPEHIVATGLKVGVTFGVTVIVKVVVVAHWPGVGVNVYVVVVVLFKTGDQVPVIPLLEVVGNADNVAPEHIGATALNVGVVLVLTVIVNVAAVAHWPGSGVKV
jgi:hypothetical protein